MATDETVRVGDRLVVEPPVYNRRKGQPVGVEVVVTKAARVWLEMEEVDGGNYTRSWRMRRDTRDSGDRNFTTSNAHFYTPEQYAQKQLEEVHDRVLRDHWVEIAVRSRHYGDKQFKADLTNWLLAREAKAAGE